MNLCDFRCATTSPITVFINFVFFHLSHEYSVRKVNAFLCVQWQYIKILKHATWSAELHISVDSPDFFFEYVTEWCHSFGATFCLLVIRKRVEGYEWNVWSYADGVPGYAVSHLGNVAKQRIGRRNAIQKCRPFILANCMLRAMRTNVAAHQHDYADNHRNTPFGRHSVLHVPT